jgi:hypothetical protein
MADAANRSGGGAVHASALARLTQLLRGPAPGEAPPGDFDVADFIGEALESLSLEQLRSFLHGRLDATRAEVRAGRGGGGGGGRGGPRRHAGVQACT